MPGPETDRMIVTTHPNHLSESPPPWIVLPKAHCINATAVSRSGPTVEFVNVLTSPQLLDTTEAQLPEHRERLYPPTVAFTLFMRQVFDVDCSCQTAVNDWAAQRSADGLLVLYLKLSSHLKAPHRSIEAWHSWLCATANGARTTDLMRARRFLAWCDRVHSN
jgi:hypothetical protein